MDGLPIERFDVVETGDFIGGSTEVIFPRHLVECSPCMLLKVHDANGDDGCRIRNCGHRDICECLVSRSLAS